MVDAIPESADELAERSDDDGAGHLVVTAVACAAPSGLDNAVPGLSVGRDQLWHVITDHVPEFLGSHARPGEYDFDFSALVVSAQSADALSLGLDRV